MAIGPRPRERNVVEPRPTSPSARRWSVAIRGLRRDLGVDRSRLEDLIVATLSGEGAPEGEIGVAFVGDPAMRRMNREYRGIDDTTDVLSFSYVDEPHSGGVLGEIFISPRVAARQARDAGCSVAQEIARLAAHGVLHVLGWEHDTSDKRRKMLARQERYVGRLFGSAAS